LLTVLKRRQARRFHDVCPSEFLQHFYLSPKIAINCEGNVTVAFCQGCGIYVPPYENTGKCSERGSVARRTIVRAGNREREQEDSRERLFEVLLVRKLWIIFSTLENTFKEGLPFARIPMGQQMKWKVPHSVEVFQI